MMQEEEAEAKVSAWRKLAQAAGVAGVLVATIGVGVSVWLGLRGEITKSASVIVLSSRPFVLSEPGSSGHFQILYKRSEDNTDSEGTEIANPWILSLRLLNTGNVIIEQEDIVDPLEIRIENARLVQASVRDESFGAKPGNPSILSDKIRLEPFFLNPGDYLEYDVIMDGEPAIQNPNTVIRNMLNPIELEFNPNEKPVFINIVPLPKNIEMTLLTIATLFLFFVVCRWSLRIFFRE